MKVLIVARCKNGRYAPFITEQVDALEQQGVVCQFFGIRGKGVWGYLRQYREFRSVIRAFQPDIIHAHYGLCGVFANLQRIIPVVTTFHGSDINNARIRPWSKLAMRLSAFSVFVSRKNVAAARPSKNYALIPCGINLEDYPIVDKEEARARIGLNLMRKYVLFAGAFDNAIKNAPLAKTAVSLLPELELLELKGYTREQVSLLMQAVDAFLMTSFTEGSPQVIKEAMACGCPIVSVDVGDVKERVAGVENCLIVPSDAKLIAEALHKVLTLEDRPQGRDVIVRDGLTNVQTAQAIIRLYQSIL